MKKDTMLLVGIAVTSIIFSVACIDIFVAQAVAQATTQPPAATISGGTVASQVVDWLKVAFGTTVGALATGVAYRVLNWLGIQVTQAQKDQLQGIIVNGINDAAARASESLKNNPNLDVSIKSKVLADAVSYTQAHAADTIKALGLDPNSGQAVEAIKARIATAIADPSAPTSATANSVLKPVGEEKKS